MTTGPLVLAELLNLHDSLVVAWRAGMRAGSFLRDERPAALVVDSKSSPSDAVSVMDRTAEQMIVREVLGEFPDDGFLGEEGGERPSRSGRRWIVDPLDATVNYLYGIPLWGVSIALEDPEGVVLGIVQVPAQNQAYLAVRGVGAWSVRGGVAQRLTGSTCADLSMALVATGFGYSAARRVRQAEVLAGVVGRVRDVRRSGCAVVDFCWLAEGQIDGFYEFGLNPWDHAAGALICREAGMTVTGLHSDDDLQPMFVASAPAIADSLRTMLTELGADDMP